MEATNETALIPQSSRDLLNSHLDFWNSIEEITITNDAENGQADININKLKKGKKELEANKLNLTKKWRDKTSEVNTEYKIVVEQLENGIKKLDTAMGIYHAEQVKKEELEQKRVQAEADERIRLENERAERDLKKAEELREQGKDVQADKKEAAAEAHIEAATTTVARTIQSSSPSGTGFREYYEGAIITKPQVVQFCMTQPDLEGYITVDIAGLEKVQKNAAGKKIIPGMRFIKRFGTRAKGRS